MGYILFIIKLVIRSVRKIPLKWNLKMFLSWCPCIEKTQWEPHCCGTRFIGWELPDTIKGHHSIFDYIPLPPCRSCRQIVWKKRSSYWPQSPSPEVAFRNYDAGPDKPHSMILYLRWLSFEHFISKTVTTKKKSSYKFHYFVPRYNKKRHEIKRWK